MCEPATCWATMLLKLALRFLSVKYCCTWPELSACGKTHLSNKLGGGGAASHEVVSAPSQACQVGCCGRAAGKGPRGCNHTPCQLCGCYGNRKSQLQITCNHMRLKTANQQGSGLLACLDAIRPAPSFVSNSMTNKDTMPDAHTLDAELTSKAGDMQ